VGRPSGSRNRAYDDRRLTLCRALVPHLMVDGHPATLSDLARAAEVSVPTLRHYFGDRDGVALAVIEQAHQDIESFLASWKQSELPVRDALVSFLSSLVFGWRSSPLGTLFVGGLTMGLEDAEKGHGAVNHVLEPTLQTLEARLGVHRERGELAHGLDLRVGALMLVSPVVLALLHQDGLDGAACRPLDVDALVEQVVDGFLRGYGRTADGGPAP